MAGAINVGSVQVAVLPDTSRFASDLRAKLGNLPAPQVKVDADTTAARARIDDLGRTQRAQIQVDADTARARVQIDDLTRDRRATINVDADTARARAELAGVGSAASSSQGGISGLMAAGIALGPAIIPVAAAVAAALAGIGAAAGAGLAGVGVLALGFSGISGAVKALGDAQASAGKDAATYARSQQSAGFAIANAQSGVQAAEESLANVRANAANAAITAAEQVKNAQQGVADAERTAAQGVQTALQQEQSAEQALTSAQGQALTAQQALNDARVAARQTLEDLAHAVADGALQQRSAVLGIEQAKQNLDATLANPKATDLQRRQAQLAYDQAVQQLSDIQLRNQRLIEQKAAADKAGVDGSKQVVAAQQGVEQSTQRVADAQQALARAQAGVVEARRKGAEQIAKAQQSLADAERAQATQQRQSAASISSALRGVENAQRSLAQAHASAAAGAATASAASTKLAQAMAHLSPAGQAFAKFIYGLRPEFDKLRAAAQEGLLPGVEDGIKSLLPFMPSLTKFVGGLATAMGDLFREAGKALTSPFWKQAMSTFGALAAPSITSIGHTLGNIATGFAGLFVALAPLTKGILGGLEHLSKRFADFGKDAANGGLQKFIDYVRTEGPVVVKAVESIAVVAGKLIVALAPIGTVVLHIVEAVASFLSTLTPGQLLAIAGAVGTLATGLAYGFRVFKMTTEGVKLFNAVLAANPLGLVITALGFLAAGLVYAYQHSETFRSIVQGAWRGIQEAASIAWNDVIKPIFGFLSDTIRTVGEKWTALGDTFSAIWDGIVGAFRHGIAWVVDHFLGMVGSILHGVADAFGWVPGIGPKLQEAAANFDSFRDSVNKSLSGINDQTVSVTVTADFAANRQSTYNQQVPAAARRANGGSIFGPGTSTSDSIHVLASNGEHMWSASEVQGAGGHGAVESLRAAARSGVLRRANGGPIGFDVRSAFPSVAAFSSAAHGLVSSVAQGAAGALLANLAAPTGGTGANKWSDAVIAALALLHQPVTLLGAVLRRINLESGGNPQAINLWDSNAQAGHPSQGLMQTIPSTFNAYAGPLRARGITDPLANIYAGLNYALHRYGSIGAIDPRVRPYGYDSGGMLDPGVHLVYNGTGRPERVLDAHQTALFEQAMAETAAAPARQSAPGPVDLSRRTIDELARQTGARVLTAMRAGA